MTILLIASLLVAFWQDIRDRALSVWLLVVLLLLAVTVRLTGQPGLWYVALSDTAINLLLLGWLLLLLTGYVSLRSKKMTWPVGKWLGLGDVIFWLVPALLFPPPSFVTYWISSSLFALIAHLLLRWLLSGTYGSSIPLAGMQALWMVPYLLFR